MLDWEEGIFVSARSLYRSISSRVTTTPDQNQAVELAGLRQSLFVFARLIVPGNFKIFETNEPVLFKGNQICLPDKIDLFPAVYLNRELYFFKTGFAAWCTTQKEKYHPHIKIEYLLKTFHTYLPGLEERWNQLQEAYNEHCTSRKETLIQWLGTPMKGSSPENTVAPDDELEPSIQHTSTKDEIQGKSQLEVERLEEKHDAKQEVPFHSFEKVETLEEYAGIDRNSEDDSDLKDNEEALNELNMKHVIRTKERTSSIYAAELSLEGTHLEINSKNSEGIPYPEWNVKKNLYREAWCRLKEAKPKINSSGTDWAKTAPSQYYSEVVRVRKKLAGIQANQFRRKNQPDGNEFDLEALIDAKLDILNGHSPDEKIYECKTLHPLDAHLHFLIDISFSTEGYYKGKNILETLKRTVYILGAALSEFVESLEISAFYSDTRKSCYFLPIKKSEDSWGKCLDKLGSLEPSGYTRIGPALRHANKLMQKSSSPRRSVILISDGKPNDYDRYEGRYGISDVRKAVQEGHKDGIMTFALAFDDRSSEHLPQMFHRGMFCRVKEPHSLVVAATELAIKIKYG